MRIVFTLILLFCNIKKLSASDIVGSVLKSPFKKNEINTNFSSIDESSPLPVNDKSKCHSADLTSLGLVYNNTITSLADKMTCDYKDEFLSNNDLVFEYCKSLSSCSENQIKDKLISDKDKDFIKKEAFSYLGREYTSKALEKYNSSKTEDVKRMLNYVKLMPTNDQNQIHVELCKEKNKSTETVCSKSTDMAQLVQSAIQENTYKTTTENLKTIQGNTNVASTLGNISKLHTKLKMLTVEKQVANLDTVKLINELEEADNVNVKVNAVNNPKIVAGLIYESLRDNVENKTGDWKNKLKNVIKEKLLKSSLPETDSILTYHSSNRSNVIEKAVSEIPFDFDNENTEKNIDEYLNKVRVIMANAYLAEDCSKVNLTMNDVCNSVEEAKKSNVSYDKLKAATKDPFQEMIDFYQKENTAESNEKIKHLNNLKNDNKEKYKKYFIYALKNNICLEKFPTLVSTQKNTNIHKEVLKEHEMAATISHQEAVIALQVAANTNQYFKKELDSLGITISPNKASKSIQITSKLSSENNSADAITTISSKNAVGVNVPNSFSSSDDTTRSSNFQIQPVSPKGTIVNENTPSSISRVAENRPAKETDFQARIDDLTKQLKTKSEVVNNGLANGKDSTVEGESISSLRVEIEKLKAEQAKSNANKAPKVLAENKKEQINNSANTAQSSFGQTNRIASNMDTHAFSNNSISSTVSSLSSANFDGGGAKGSSGRNQSAVNSVSVNDKMPTKTRLLLTELNSKNFPELDIQENLSDTEIVTRLAKNDDQPFLIRENGILKKIIKSKTANGEFTISKITLSELELTKISMAVGNIRDVKEVGRSPSRLLNLNQLLKTIPIKESVKNDAI